MAARRRPGEPATRSISSGAKTTTRSGLSSALARRPTPFTRSRLRPPVPSDARADDRHLDDVPAEAALDPREVGPPADQLAVGARSDGTGPSASSTIASSRLVLPAAFGPHDELRTRPEGRVERGVSAEVEQADGVEQGLPGPVAAGPASGRR